MCEDDAADLTLAGAVLADAPVRADLAEVADGKAAEEALVLALAGADLDWVILVFLGWSSCAGRAMESG
ncbi:hypothetical protein THIARS_70827 [Thiomonas delicata]|uniref:Uncharacterized protein n=1 Tax=Thiomonas delicata TaxID=364030 RepID=A0A238D7C4_THIDL|nr:hypothetical protein THIARS_70827 [Thiomonas delicata]